MYFFKKNAIVCAFFIFIGILLLTAAQSAQAAGLGEDEGPTCYRPYKLFAPVINKAPVEMSGNITYQGAPAPDQLVELRLYHDGKFATAASAVSDANGDYSFTIPGLLEDDQVMYLRWLNPSDNDAWLASWFCKTLWDYPQEDVACSFDIENVALAASPASVSLPFTFQWQMRGTTSDSYQHELMGLANAYPWSSSTLLGYVGSYDMTYLPNKFSTNKDYAWGITVNGPDGSGKSFYTQTVRFSNQGSKSGKSSAGGELLRNNLLPDPPMP